MDLRQLADDIIYAGQQAAANAEDQPTWVRDQWIKDAIIETLEETALKPDSDEIYNSSEYQELSTQYRQLESQLSDAESDYSQALEQLTQVRKELQTARDVIANLRSDLEAAKAVA